MVHHFLNLICRVVVSFLNKIINPRSPIHMYLKETILERLCVTCARLGYSYSNLPIRPTNAKLSLRRHFTGLRTAMTRICFILTLDEELPIGQRSLDDIMKTFCT